MTTSSEAPTPPNTDEDQAAPSRRTTVGALTVGLAGSLALAYGGLAAVLGRFLFPAGRFPRHWLFVEGTAGFRHGEAIAYELPDGQPVTITRLAESGTADDFLALSSTCPHLGCRVQWQGQHKRFFCPCHNGVFTPQGEAVSGPPADAGQRLPQFPLKVENELLFIEVPTNDLTAAHDATKPLRRDTRPPSRPGHDPCLCDLPRRTERA